MARPRFTASQEIRDMVKSGSMIGATWEHIAINVSEHLEAKYQKAKFVNEKAAKNNEPEPFNLSAMPRKVSKRTLQRTCQEDYDDGVPVLHAKLTSPLTQSALSGLPASIFFALKTRSGWK